MNELFEPKARDGVFDDLAPVDGLTPRCSPRWVAAQLRSRVRVPDRAFDYHLPDELRAVSSNYWSPLAVALKAARWFDDLGVRSVVDVGSGAGKFCIAAALAGGSEYVGLEQRGRLVTAARELARIFECSDRVRFIEGELGVASIPAADAYYLYNPFEENTYEVSARLDGDIELSESRYARDLAAAQALFESAPVGTVVLTYNGFGASLPAGYRELRASHEHWNMLQLWQKDGRGRGPST